MAHASRPRRQSPASEPPSAPSSAVSSIRLRRLARRRQLYPHVVGTIAGRPPRHVDRPDAAIAHSTRKTAPTGPTRRRGRARIVQRHPRAAAVFWRALHEGFRSAQPGRWLAECQSAAARHWGGISPAQSRQAQRAGAGRWRLAPDVVVLRMTYTQRRSRPLLLPLPQRRIHTIRREMRREWRCRTKSIKQGYAKRNIVNYFI